MTETIIDAPKNKDPLIHTTISSWAFGPYDNAFILLGFSDGTLMGLNPASLNIKFAFKIGTKSIKHIRIDPLDSVLLVTENIQNDKTQNSESKDQLAGTMVNLSFSRKHV